MKLDLKTVSHLASMPDDRLWHTLHLLASGAGIELSERKRNRIDYDALRRTLASVTEADVARINELSDTYHFCRKDGRRR